MNETCALARFVAKTQFTDLPCSLVDDCKITVLDAIAAGFVGAVQPWARRIVAVVRVLGGTPEASVIQRCVRSSDATRRRSWVNSRRRPSSTRSVASNR
jgi:2-methylcitrate dehydratase PrpD